MNFKTRKRFWILTAMALFALLLAGCVRSEGTSELSEGLGQQSPDAAGQWEFEDEVVIGRVAPMTGVLSSFGEGTPYVEERAIQAINEQGGVIVNGKRCSLRLESRDSGSGMKGAAEAAMELIRDGIDIMIVSHTADTVIPVSAVCEREKIACISVDAPASAWRMGGPYSNSWHAHFDNEREMLCFYDAWEQVETNRTIGLMTANDNEGVEISTFIHDFAKRKGYTIVDEGAYYIGQQDYSEFIQAFDEAECDIILGVMNTEDFSRFWTQLARTDYDPKLCTVAKACLFESDIRKLGKLGDGLVTEVWWTADFPYQSSIDGTSSAELAEDYQKNCQPQLREVPATVGYKYANVEILYDILKRAGTLELNRINLAASETDLDTIIGHVSYNKDHISLMSCVTGQWVMEKDGTFHREIIGNYLIPTVDITADIKILEKNR